MSIEGQGHFFTIYFPGFVCFVLYLDKISGERLQDHWSSGAVLTCTHNICFKQNYKNSEKIQLKIVIFTAVKNRCILHRRVFGMLDMCVMSENL